jgi:hypothetical protein
MSFFDVAYRLIRKKHNRGYKTFLDNNISSIILILVRYKSENLRTEYDS